MKMTEISYLSLKELLNFMKYETNISIVTEDEEEVYTGEVKDIPYSIMTENYFKLVQKVTSKEDFNGVVVVLLKPMVK